MVSINIQSCAVGTLFIFGLLMGWDSEAVLIRYKDGSILFTDIKCFCFTPMLSSSNRSESWAVISGPTLSFSQPFLDQGSMWLTCH